MVLIVTILNKLLEIILPDNSKQPIFMWIIILPAIYQPRAKHLLPNLFCILTSHN